MEDVIHAVHGISDRGQLPHIPEEEFYLIGGLWHLRLKFMAHIVLLFLVAGKNADLTDIGIQEAV